MQTLKASALLCVFVIGVSMSPAQDVEIRSGSFAILCKATEDVKSNPDFLAIHEMIVADLRTLAEGNQITLTKNLELRADILKSAASGKILNGVMVKPAIGGAEPDTSRGIFFPCKAPGQSKQDYQEKIYNDYFKMLIDRIKNLTK